MHVSEWFCGQIKQSCLVCMWALFPKKRSSWQLLLSPWRLSPAFIGAVVQRPVFIVLSGTPRLELCYQEGPHESPHGKHKVVSAAMSNHIIISSFLIPSLWICQGHEIVIPAYSIASCGWKSQRNHLLQLSQEMEGLAVWVSHVPMLLLN